MIADDLRAIFEQLMQGPVIAVGAVRHVYLWHGDWEALFGLVPAALRCDLDLYALVQQLPRTPYAFDEAQRLLRTSIEKVLRERLDQPPRQVLLVRGCALLARYSVPIQPFYAFASDRRVVVLVVPRQDSEFAPSVSLPDFVRLDQMATFTALSRIVGQECVVQG